MKYGVDGMVTDMPGCFSYVIVIVSAEPQRIFGTKKEITYANACAGYLHFIKVVSVTSAPFDERGGRRSERYYRLKQFTW